MRMIVVRNMIRPKTGQEFQRVFIAQLESVDEVGDLLEAIADHCSSEESDDE